eukprot:gene8783-biopygen604
MTMLAPRCVRRGVGRASQCGDFGLCQPAFIRFVTPSIRCLLYALRHLSRHRRRCGAGGDDDIVWGDNAVRADVPVGCTINHCDRPTAGSGGGGRRPTAGTPPFW